MTTFSIGIMREDGDFAILATLNNNDGLIDSDAFATMVENLRATLAQATEDEVIALERQDTPDYVCTDEDCWG